MSNDEGAISLKSLLSYPTALTLLTEVSTLKEDINVTTDAVSSCRLCNSFQG